MCWSICLGPKGLTLQVLRPEYAKRTKVADVLAPGILWSSTATVLSTQYKQDLVSP